MHLVDDHSFTPQRIEGAALSLQRRKTVAVSGMSPRARALLGFAIRREHREALLVFRDD
jgi:hypothetical protein